MRNADVTGSAVTIAKIGRVIEHVCRYQALYVSGVLLWGLTSMVLYGVFMRRVLHAPAPFVFELPGFLILPVVAMGWAYAQTVKAHVGVDIVASHLPPTTRRILDTIVRLVFLAYLSFLLLASLMRWSYVFQKGDLTPESGIPLWTIEMFLPVGLAVFTLQLLVECIQAISHLISKPLKS